VQGRNEFKNVLRIAINRLSDSRQAYQIQIAILEVYAVQTQLLLFEGCSRGLSNLFADFQINLLLIGLA
jgi:hypothetical protein